MSNYILVVPIVKMAYVVVEAESQEDAIQQAQAAVEKASSIWTVDGWMAARVYLEAASLLRNGWDYGDDVELVHE